MNETLVIKEDGEILQEASTILNWLGLDLETYLKMSMRQLVGQRKVPFDITMPSYAPSELTWRSMIEAEAKTLGLISDNSEAFTNAQEVIEFLQEASK